MSEHLVSPDEVRAFDADARAGFERRSRPSAGKDRKTDREPAERCDQHVRAPRRAARPGRGLPRAQGDLGLMDFSDQIELARPAGRRAARGRASSSATSSGGAARRVPGHLGRPGLMLRGCSRADPARPGPPGDRGRRPQPGDLRLARRLGVQHPRLRPRLPGGRRAAVVPTLPAHRQPPLRRADPRGRQRARRAALRRATPRSTPLEPKPGAEPGVGRTIAVHETYADELAWLAEQVPAAHARWTTPSWREIGVLTRDNAHAPTSSTR